MALCIDSLSVRAKDRFIITDISLSFNKSLGIIGPSGCGKTTLLKTILGLSDFLVSGRIYFMGQLLQRDQHIIVPIDQRCFAYIPQDLALWPHLTVKETLELSKRFVGTTHFLPDEMINLCGLDLKKTALPCELSGGEKQRLALARALMGRPRLLVLDEPFSGLDVVAKAKLIRLIKDLEGLLDFSLIFISHDLKETLVMAEEIAVMDQGRIFWQGLRGELKDGAFPRDWNPLNVLN